MRPAPGPMKRLFKAPYWLVAGAIFLAGCTQIFDTHIIVVNESKHRFKFCSRTTEDCVDLKPWGAYQTAGASNGDPDGLFEIWFPEFTIYACNKPVPLKNLAKPSIEIERGWFLRRRSTTYTLTISEQNYVTACRR